LRRWYRVSGKPFSYINDIAKEKLSLFGNVVTMVYGLHSDIIESAVYYSSPRFLASSLVTKAKVELQRSVAQLADLLD
jgi:hypothetical protein